MNMDILLSMSLPVEIFSTFHRFDNYYIDDMQYGDLSDLDFQQLGLDDISARVDPFRCLEFDRMSAFNIYRSRYDHLLPKGVPISRQRCADIMFDEMKELSTQFASGQYAHLICNMIDHFHYGNGQQWTDVDLNRAYDEVIQGTGTNHLLMEIVNTIDEHLFLKQQASMDYFFFTDLKRTIRNDIRLPKFNRFMDRFNGLGISVHDIYAQKVSLEHFQRYAMSWEGLLAFKAQDHFGLGKEDITRELYKNFRFFRIWFFLQRHRDYAYKPFMTNFNAHVHIKGGV